MPKNLYKRFQKRRGTMLLLVLLCVVVLLVMALFCIDIAYMQMVQTENQVATDAAAKAGAEALAREQSSEAAIKAAIKIGEMNRLGGQPLKLSPEDIELGKAEQNKDGSWSFVESKKEQTAVRVHSRQNGVDLFFGKIFGTSYFSPNQVATAAHVDQEIVLAIDRSHSMCFDLSGVKWKYPAGTPNSPAEFFYPPHTGSRWDSLERAIQLFLSEVVRVAKSPRVGLVTWGSEITLDMYEGKATGRTFPAVTVDEKLGFNYAGIQTKIDARGNDLMLGGTDMYAGLEAALSMLTAPDALPLAKKTIILLTDGEWNIGKDPEELAKDAEKQNIVIHTVTFLPATDQKAMKKIAKKTGGAHYHAENEAELLQAFQELSRTLPVVLTD